MTDVPQTLSAKIKAEFDRAPVATVFTPVGVLVGIAGIVVAWLLTQPVGAAASRVGGATISSGARPAVPDASAALLIIGVFLALTPAMASVCRFFYAVNRYAAVPLSIVVASLSIFLSRLNANLLGYGALPSERVASLDDLLFYGTVTVFLAVAGGQPLLDFIRQGAPKKGEEITSDYAIGTFGLTALTVLLWGWLVGWTQRHLWAALLP